VQHVWRWVRGRKTFVICGIVLVSVAAWGWYGWWSSFEPEYYFEADVSGTAVETVYDIAEGQVFKLKIYPQDEDDYRQSYGVVIRQATRISCSRWTTGDILMDYPDVGRGDLVKFAAPNTCSYEVSVKSRSGDSLPVRVYCSIGE